MSPIRLVIIAILVYIAYLIFTSGRKKKKGGKSRLEKKESGPVSDVLVEDPVCHSLVPKQQAVNLQHQDETIYFCSDECCRKFIEEQK